MPDVERVGKNVYCEECGTRIGTRTPAEFMSRVSRGKGRFQEFRVYYGEVAVDCPNGHRNLFTVSESEKG